MVRTPPLVMIALLGASCFNTRIYTGAPSDGVSRKHRQWFTIGGLVPLSGPAGSECGPGGLARAESRVGGIDILISIGIGLVAGAIAVGACPLDDTGGITTDEARRYGTCVSGVSGLGAFLLGTRTVDYQCAAPVPAAPPSNPWEAPR